MDRRLLSARVMKMVMLSGLAMVAGSWELEARACSRVIVEGGYVTKIDVTSEIVPNAASGVACMDTRNSCQHTYWKESLRALKVSVEVEETVPDGGEPRYVVMDPYVVLKDAAGEIIARTTGTNRVAYFATLGASVCVRTTSSLERHGIDGGAAGEVCVPVTITSLEMTDTERADRTAAVETACREVESTPGSTPDARTKDDRALASEPESGGCRAAGGSGAFGGAGLVVLALVRARRRRERGSADPT